MKKESVLEMRKFAEKLVSILVRLLSAVYGGFIGLLIVSYRYLNYPMELPFWEHMGIVMGLFGVFLACACLTVILHELGHLVFGLLTGYRFVLFRAGSLTWIREGERIVLRRFRIPGTAGQCSMSPPELRDGKMPVTLFGLGGSIMNLIWAVVFLVLNQVIRGSGFWRLVFMILALDNLHAALVNGIPVRTRLITNDGYNAVSLKREPEAIRAFRDQLRYNALMVQGVRLRDMPEDLFRMPSDGQMRNRIMSDCGVMVCCRLLDRQEFGEADAQIEHIVAIESGMSEIKKGLLELERYYIELMGENRPEIRKARMTRLARRARSRYANALSVIRLEYAVAKLEKRNEKLARKQRKRFEKLAKRHPFAGEAASEREQLARIDERAAMTKE